MNVESAPTERVIPAGVASVDSDRPSFATLETGCADFLARVAHDLRSPLGVIAEVLPTVQRDLGEHLSEEQKLLLRLADRSLFRLRLFVERMRLVADLELSQMRLVRGPTPLDSVLQHCVDTMLANEPRRGVTILFDRGSAAHVVDVDADRLGHVILELLSNALRHACRCVRVAVVTDQDEVGVIVEDDGEGMRDAEIELLFRRFVERPSRNGLGIGLSLARDLVQAHGGRLSYERSALPPGRVGTQGARFVVSFAA